MDQEIHSNTEGTTAAVKLQPDMSIHLTDAAIAEIRHRMTQDFNAEKKILRLRVGAGAARDYRMKWSSWRQVTPRTGSLCSMA